MATHGDRTCVQCSKLLCMSMLTFFWDRIRCSAAPSVTMISHSASILLLRRIWRWVCSWWGVSSSSVRASLITMPRCPVGDDRRKRGWVTLHRVDGRSAHALASGSKTQEIAQECDAVTTRFQPGCEGKRARIGVTAGITCVRVCVCVYVWWWESLIWTHHHWPCFESVQKHSFHVTCSYTQLYAQW